MFTKKNKILLTLNNGLRRDYRSYESDILSYFEDKNLRNYKEPLRELFKFINDRAITHIMEKINKNKNKPSFCEDMILDYFRKYNIETTVIPRKNKRKKEDLEVVRKRVAKHRKFSDKVPFQCRISPELKTKLDKLRKENNLTYEQLLEYFVKISPENINLNKFV